MGRASAPRRSAPHNFPRTGSRTRIGYTTHSSAEFLDGKIDELVDALRKTKIRRGSRNITGMNVGKHSLRKASSGRKVAILRPMPLLRIRPGRRLSLSTCTLKPA